MKERILWFQRVLLVLLVGLALAGCGAVPKANLVFDDIQYHYVQTEGDVKIYQSEDGQVLRITPLDQGAVVTVKGETYQVSGSPTVTQVTFPDGRELTGNYSPNSSSIATGIEVNFSVEDSDHVDELHDMVFGRMEESGEMSPLVRYLFGGLLLCAGVLEGVNPRLAWQIAEGWRYQNVEPSNLFLAFSRAGGVIFVLVAVFIMFGVIR